MMFFNGTQRTRPNLAHDQLCAPASLQFQNQLKLRKVRKGIILEQILCIKKTLCEKEK
jgi:hypothetical protein